MRAEIRGLCSRCRNRDKCSAPCAPIEFLLDAVSASYLKEFEKRDTIELKNWRELSIRVFDDGTTALDRMLENSTYREELFSFSADSIKTRVFYERFFKGSTIPEIADNLDISEDLVASHWHFAKKRLFTVLEALDGRDRAIRWYKASNHELTENQKYFILTKIMGMSIQEVSELIPNAPHRVALSKRMNRLYDKYMKKYQDFNVRQPATI